MSKTKNIKKILIGIMIILGIFMLMRSRIGSVKFKDTYIKVFRFISGKDEYFFEWVLGKYTLQTEYGEIILKPFCNIESINNRLIAIPSKEFKKRGASHELILVDHSLNQNISIYFIPRENYRIDTIIIPEVQIFSFDNYYIHVDRISFPLDENETIGSHLNLLFLPETNKITLKDKTEIEFFEIYTKEKEYRDYFRFRLNITINTWSIYTKSPNAVHFSVKRPEWVEAIKSTKISFESGWGNYIESREYVEEPAQTK